MHFTGAAVLSLRLTDGFSRFAVSGGQLMLLFVGFQMDHPLGWFGIAIGIALLSVFGWLGSLRRWRSIRDTPTSLVASAAQGYVELIGRGKALEGLPLVSPLTGLPCLWYHYTVEEKDSEGKWKQERSETSESFLPHPRWQRRVPDRSGGRRGDLCTRKDSVGRRRRTLYPVAAACRTKGSTSSVSSQRAAAWCWSWTAMRRHRRTAGRHGSVTIRSYCSSASIWMETENSVSRSGNWRAARHGARWRRRHREIRSAAGPARHALSRGWSPLPHFEYGRRTKLARRYQWWAWGHLLIFFGGAGGCRL